MQDELTWKLSLLVDDELPPEEAIVLLERINQDPDLRYKWYQYQTIRHAIRSNGEGLALQADFLERIQSVLENESISKHQETKQPSGGPGKINLNTWIAIPLAMAAMVVIVIMLRSQSPEDKSSGSVPLLTASQTQAPVLKVTSGHPVQNPVSSVESSSSSSSLEDFLLVHSEDSLYQQGPQHMLSYARIISHDKH